MSTKFYHSKEPFLLECGRVLPEITIAYNTFGELLELQDNVIWVCHALTANSDISDWWGDTLQEGQFLCPKNNFIICANILGSPYGTTSPLSIDPTTGEPYYNDFPLITVRDIVKAHCLLAKYLNISKVKMLIGSSIGGFQVMEWLIQQPDFAETAVLIATGANSDAWIIAFNESQRMAFRCDPTYGERRADAGANGLAVARSIAMLSYRGSQAYILSQEDGEPKIDNFKASSYQCYQGAKLVKRFNAYCYYRLTQAIDSHDVGRGRGGLAEALGKITARCTIVYVDSDVLFTPNKHTFLHKYINNSELNELKSDFGHDGFLVESKRLNKIIIKHLNHDN